METSKIPFVLSEKYFQIVAWDPKTDYVAAQCQLCPLKPIYKGKLSVTSNFVTHFTRAHSLQYATQFAQDKKAYSVSRKRSFAEVEGPFVLSYIERNLDKSLSKMEKLLMKFVVKGMHPLTIVEQKEFIELCKELNPGVRIVSADTLSRKIDQCFASLKDEMKRILSIPKHVCIAADAWTCKGMSRSFMGVTVHWITEDLKRRSMAIACRRFQGSHTFDRITKLLNTIFDEYGLPIGKIMKVVTDNGTYFVKAFRLYGAPENSATNLNMEHGEQGDNFEDSSSEAEIESDEDSEVDICNLDHILDNSAEQISVNKTSYLLPSHARCASHTLNLVCTTDIKKLNAKTHQKAFSKCYKIWNKISRSTLSSESADSLMGVKLKKPGETRWNSLYDSLQMLMENKSNLPRLCETLELAKLSTAEIGYLEGYLACVKPLAEALDYLQKELEAYYGQLLPTVFSTARKQELLKQSPPAHCANLITAIVNGFTKRFKEPLELNENKKDAIIAAISHPGFKLRWLPVADREKMKNLFIDVIVSENGGSIEETKVKQPSCGTSNNFFLFEDEDRENEGLNDLTKSMESTIKGECLKYLADNNQDLTMLFSYPNILKAFKKYNTPLPSSASVERMFSFSGMILNPKRRRLGDSLFEKLTILKYN